MNTTEDQTKATPTNIASARKSRATKSADRNSAAAKTQPTPTPPAAAPEPQPTINLGPRQSTTWVPVVTTSDGRTLTCEHSRYGHESEKAAGSCARRMINLDRAPATS
jgi:hypothetical protein